MWYVTSFSRNISSASPCKYRYAKLSTIECEEFTIRWTRGGGEELWYGMGGWYYCVVPLSEPTVKFPHLEEEVLVATEYEMSVEALWMMFIKYSSYQINLIPDPTPEMLSWHKLLWEL